MKRPPLLFILVALAVISCAPEPLEFADWTIPVPEGTPVHEYAHVFETERSARIELVDDLVVGGNDPQEAFFRARDLAVDEAGNIYVLDVGNHRIQVFDPEGNYRRTIGAGEGQGPGEFNRPITLAIVGERLVVADNGNTRFSVWSLDGEHLADHSAESRYVNSDQLTGLPGGDLLARYGFGDMPGFTFVLARLSVEGEELQRHLEVTTTPIAMPKVGRATAAPVLQLPFEFPWARFLPPDGLYLTLADEYQILAADLDGAPRWALRVAMPRPPFSAAEEAIVARGREQWGVPALSAANFDTPDHFPSLSRIAVDDRRRLYIFPFTASAVYRPADGVDVPVDVFSPDGARLFTGLMPDVEWRAAKGDYVYAFRTNEATAEQEVVRYRIVAPFERNP